MQCEYAIRTLLILFANWSGIQNLTQSFRNKFSFDCFAHLGTLQLNGLNLSVSLLPVYPLSMFHYMLMSPLENSFTISYS